MSIEINEMVVQMQIDEEGYDDFPRDRTVSRKDLEKFKSQIISQCRDMFYTLIDEQKER